MRYWHMGLTGAVSKSLDAFHRKQLSTILGICCPQRISNSEIRQRCNTERPNP